MENHINLEMDDYFKSLKEADKYKDKKKPYENKYSEPITNELDQYMKNLSEEQRIKAAKKASINKKEPSGIIYDFMKIANHTIEDITMSVSKSANKLVEDMTYSIYSLKKPYESRIEVKENLDTIKEKEFIKQESKTVDMKKELDTAKKTDKELYKNLESISRITERRMQPLNDTYKEYNDLLNMANECNLNQGYDKRMEGIKIYGESKRSIESDQAQLVSIAKGETKEQQFLKNSEKAMNYINSAEKKIENLKSQNKLFDISGNMERNQVIKDIKNEIRNEEQILKYNGINGREDFNKLKDEVIGKEGTVKSLIESENARYKEELKEQKLLNQIEQKSEKRLEENVKELQSTKTKSLQKER